MTMKKLNDVFPEWFDGKGVFSILNKYDVPWKTHIYDKDLDIIYHGNHSGNKYVSPFLDIMLSQENVEQAIRAIFTLNGINWQKEWETLWLQYNPIENYSMIETESGNSKDNIKQHAATTETPGETTTITNTSNTESNNDTFGFNSSNAVNDTKNTQSGDSTSTQTRGGVNDSTSDATSEATNENTRTLTRAGNIGVTTSQQMLQSERDLWMWNFIKEVVFKDIDYMLTLAVY